MVRTPFVLSLLLMAAITSAAPSPDDARLSKLIVGKWRSPRHDYEYRADGTWIMLPGEIDGIKMTHGVWRIEHGQLIEHSFTPGDSDKSYAIQKLTKKEVLYGDVYHMVRLAQ